MKVKHKITMIDMPFAGAYIVNWYENEMVVEDAVLTYKEMYILLSLIELWNDK